MNATSSSYAEDEQPPQPLDVAKASDTLPQANGSSGEPTGRGNAKLRRNRRRRKLKRRRDLAAFTKLVSFDPTELHPKDFKPTYLLVRKKFLRDPQSLSQEELKFLVNQVPSTHKMSLSPQQIVDLFDSNALGIDVLSRCYLKELNDSVRMLCCKGHTNKAAKLVDHLVRTYKFNQHTFAMFFDGCAVRRDLSMALTHWIIWAKAGLLDEMGPAGSCALLKCVIKSDVDRAADVMVVLHDWNAPMNSKCYNILIHAFSSHGYISDAMDIFGLMQVAVDPELKPDVFSYQHLMNGVMRAQQWDLVKGIYSAMMRQGVTPDAPLAAAFIKGFTAAADMQGALNVFDNLSTWGLQRNGIHINTLLIAYAHQGDQPQCERLLRVLLDAGLEPDGYTVLAMLTAASRCEDCTPEKVTSVLRLMDAHGIRRNTFISTGVINAFRNCRSLPAEERKARALEEYRAMMHARIDVTAETVNSLICLLSECDDVEGAFAMLHEMARLGVEPTSHTYTLLSMIAMDHGLIEKAEEFNELKRTMTLLNGTLQANSRGFRPMW